MPSSTDDLATVGQKLSGKMGFPVEGFAPAGTSPIQPFTPPQAAAPPPAEPGPGANALSAFGQIAAPLAMGLARRMAGASPAGALATGAAGVAGGLLPLMAARGGLPSMGDVASTVGTELINPVTRAVGRVMKPIGQALGVSGEALGTLRRVAPVLYNPERVAGRTLQWFGKAVSTLEEPAQKMLTADLNRMGINLGKMDTAGFRTLVRETPEKAAAAFRLMETATGRKLPTDLMRLWVGDVLSQAGRQVRSTVGTGTPGLLVRPGGRYVLNGKTVVGSWNRLSAEGRASMGPGISNAMGRLTEVLGKFPKADKGLGQLSEIPLDAPIGALRQMLGAVQRHSATASLGGLGAVGAGYGAFREAQEHPVAAGAMLAGAGTVALGRAGWRRLLTEVMAHPEGMQWLTGGLQQQAMGVPLTMVTDSMGRALLRSPALVRGLQTFAQTMMHPNDAEQGMQAGPEQ
jgi:hypothetical protein